MSALDGLRRRLGLHYASPFCWCRKCKRQAAIAAARVRACKHINLRSNTDATAYDGTDREAWVCLGCGTGVVRRWRGVS